jgi:dienelactone hydrolase
VVPGMVDALIKHPHVDPSRVVLVGRSFGGLIVPRGASGEHRLERRSSSGVGFGLVTG